MASIITTSRVAVVGIGLLGGSIARRLRDLNCRSVFGIARNTDTLHEACNDGVLEAGSDVPGEVLPVVDITFICLPLTATVDFVRNHIDQFRPGSIVTDVGSVKGTIVNDLRAMLIDKGVYFIGSHPMAGSEKSGYAYSTSNLYQDKIVFLTPTADDDEQALYLLREFWHALGAHPIELAADRHDSAVAATSHVPHLVASALVHSALVDGDPEAQALAAAGGFNSTTRIAASNPSMWTEICRHNQNAVLTALDNVQNQLTAVRRMINDSQWQALNGYLENARDVRSTWHRDHGENRGF